MVPSSIRRKMVLENDSLMTADWKFFTRKAILKSPGNPAKGRTIAMNLAVRKDSLKTKHETLESEIEFEEGRPHPDDVHLHELKKQKLHIKDELNALESN